MKTPRMPSQSQIRSQVRSATRKAERDAEREIAQAQRRAQSEVDREVSNWRRDTERRLRAARPTVRYTATERQYLQPVQQQAQAQAERHPESSDVFLCHAWADKEDAARQLYDFLGAYGVDVWFSEEHVPLGASLTREIDKGLRASKVGVVLVTPAMLASLPAQGLADKELSALLATDRVIPVVHGTSFEALREESPLLASRSGLSTEDSSLEDVAVKIANTVRPEELA